MLFSISGRKATGKSTASNFLIRNGFKKASFATGLKEYIGELYNWSQEDLNTQIGKEILLDNYVNWDAFQCKKLSDIIGIKLIYDDKAKTFTRRREALQYIGTEVLRSYDKDFHIKEFKNRYSDGDFVCDDVRFLNELDMISNMGGESLFILRPYFWDYSNHSSETTLNYTLFDKLLINKGNLQDFNTKIVDLFTNILNKDLVQFDEVNPSPFLHKNEQNAFLAGLLNNYIHFYKIDGRYKFYVECPKEAGNKILKLLSDYVKSYYIESDNFSINFDDAVLIEDLKLWNIEPFLEKNFKIPEYALGNNDYLIASWISGLFYEAKQINNDEYHIYLNKNVSEFVFNWLNISGSIESEFGLSNYNVIKYNSYEFSAVVDKLYKGYNAQM